MSLINDALKRASESKPPPTTEAGAPLRLAEHRRANEWPLFVLPVLALVILGVAGWFFYKGWDDRRLPGSNPRPTAISARETSAEKSSVAEFSQTPNSPAKPPVSPANATQIGRNAPGVSPAERPATNSAVPTNVSLLSNSSVAAAEPPKPTFPMLKLQGVFFRPSSPSVLINSKTVSVGEKVAGAKVLRIERDSVTVEWNGETKVLTLD